MIQFIHLGSVVIEISIFSDFYRQDQSKLAQTAIPDEFLEIGMICGAMFNSEWHRGKIVDIFEETVKVIQ